MYDPDYAGVHVGPERCHHHLPCHKYVAFEGTNTGRRFLGCGCKVRTSLQYLVHLEILVHLENVVTVLVLWMDVAKENLVSYLAPYF
jgi:hypothetical protein